MQIIIKGNGNCRWKIIYEPALVRFYWVSVSVVYVMYVMWIHVAMCHAMCCVLCVRNETVLSLLQLCLLCRLF